MLWILLSRNASTNSKSFHHNSWEMKFILSTQGASRTISPLNVHKCFFFGQRSYAGFFSYLFALPGYTVYMSVFCLKINQPLSPPPRPPPHPCSPQKWSARQTVEFPTCHIFFVTQHVLHVLVTGNISGHMHVLCKRNFVTFAGLMQTGKWPLLKIRGQWAMRFSDISGHRRIRICIRLPVFVYRDYE